MSSPLIAVIGSLNTDLITRTNRIPAAGETLISQAFATGSGGKGANQAVACARASRKKEAVKGIIDVRMEVAVGDDLFGQELLEGLRNDGINTENVAVKRGEKSGVAVILVEEQTGENRILMSPNANFSLKPTDFAGLAAQPPDLIVLQLEIPLDTTLQILKIAQENKIEVLMNPAPAQRLPEEAYSAITHLIVNETEASIITATKEEEAVWRRWGDHTETLVQLGVPHVTVTLGSQGVLYLDTVGEKVHILGAEKVNVKDTTAAGDTFVGAYAVSIAQGKGKRNFKEMSNTISWANKAAAITVQRDGAQTAIPWLNELPASTMDSIGNSWSFAEWKQRNGRCLHSGYNQTPSTETYQPVVI